MTSKHSLVSCKRVSLFEEYRFIERCETEINGAWKGAHLLLFFLAFVFGSFCTFCFHMLMYLFDEKCVLFPKLMSLTSLKHNVIYEFMPPKEIADMPVDFLSTQWVEKSTCSLPTYVPLVSGIFGLVWTTMFLMCSTGSRTLTGLQRPWRVLPPVFVFSLAMGSLCIYSSVITHLGLKELCRKLGEITGSPTCTYTVNVATLTYERRIRGVYQATQLTILSAWLHTGCWLLSALLALVRVLLAVDFLLVRVSVELHGDIDKIMERNEIQIRTVSPETWMNVESECASENIQTLETTGDLDDVLTELMEEGGDLLYLSNRRMESSELSLVPEERNRLARKEAIRRVPRDKAFIVKWIYDLVAKLPLSDHPDDLAKRTTSVGLMSVTSPSKIISRQYGQSHISSNFKDVEEDERISTRVDSIIFHQATKKKKDWTTYRDQTSPIASTSKSPDEGDDSLIKLTPIFQRSLVDLHAERPLKSNLKGVSVQTDKGKRSRQGLRVQIKEKSRVVRIKSDDDYETTSENKKDVDKETQTKEKED